MPCCGKARKQFQNKVNNAKVSNPVRVVAQPQSPPKPLTREERIKLRQEKIRRRAERIAKRAERIAARSRATNSIKNP